MEREVIDCMEKGDNGRTEGMAQLKLAKNRVRWFAYLKSLALCCINRDHRVFDVRLASGEGCTEVPPLSP